MIITCEKCATRFVLDDALIKPEGSMVRCSKCRHVFTAFPVEYPEIELSDQSEPQEQDIPFDESQLQDQLDFNLSQDDDSDKDSASHSHGEDPEDTDIDFSEIEFEVQAFQEKAHEQQADTKASDSQDLDIEFDTADFEIDEPGLDFQDDDLELETQGIEIGKIEDSTESSPASASEQSDMADIEISFDQDNDADLDLDGLSFDLEDSAEEALSIDDLELETQNDGDSDLELEVDSQEDLILEEEDDDDGLDLSHDPEDALTDDFAHQEEETIEAQPDIEQKAFPSDDIKIEPDDIDVTPDDQYADKKIEQGVSEQDKFAEYDTVLEQETEPEDTDITIPDPDEEDDAAPLRQTDDEIEPSTETLIEQTPSITPLSAQSVRQKRSSKKKKGTSPAVKILLVLVLLLLAAYVAIIGLGINVPVVSDIQIPFISQWIAPKQAPQEPLKPTLDEPSINGRFVSNKSAGDLFIVTGRVKNPSDKAVSFIRVKGTLMKKNNIKAGTQIAYCGNIISDETLKSDNISDITKQMGVKQGNENINVNIKPGASVRFMLIFSNLPEDLANFTVALEGFEPAQE
ncbi:zinc-ribbon domain-containing protein [uncultured Desulfobacter sp.]|uniref:zinc-ribbon domain-containing protein n=2 Tax=uncultured Desulfobacter sp. TaxID=240139 RepID=UPI0029F5253B|nr:zinc-ribbon domain-containing protein [uncultured Desulfobacter sp.]